MIENTLIHYKTEEAFLADLNAGNISNTSICFIASPSMIYTHGKRYYCVDGPLVTLSEAEYKALVDAGEVRDDTYYFTYEDDL